MRARLLLLAGLVTFVAAGCGGGSVSRPEYTAPSTTGDDGMRLTSDAFRNETHIPSRYTCDGDDVSPPLAIDGIPAGTAVLALVVDDPDAPRGVWDHWVAYDITVTDTIPERIADLGTPGRNSWGRSGYGGPCPPSGTHRYYFTVYALDSPTGLAAGADKAALLAAIDGHVLAEATLMGRYSR